MGWKSPADGPPGLGEVVSGPASRARLTGAVRLAGQGSAASAGTIAYAHGEADPDKVQRWLRRVWPSPAPLRIDAVHLVERDHRQHGRLAFRCCRNHELSPPRARQPCHLLSGCEFLARLVELE